MNRRRILSVIIPVIVIAAPSLSHANTKVDTSVYDKGLALDNLGNHTGAIQYFDKALAIDPHYIRALTSKGIIIELFVDGGIAQI